MVVGRELVNGKGSRRGKFGGGPEVSKFIGWESGGEGGARLS